MTAHLPPDRQEPTAIERTDPIGTTDAPLSPTSLRGPLQALSGETGSAQVLPGFDPPAPASDAHDDRVTVQRFDLEPLADAMGVRLVSPTDPTGNQWMPEHDIGVVELSERLHIPVRTLARWRAEGIPRYGSIRDDDMAAPIDTLPGFDTPKLPRVTTDIPDWLAVKGAGLNPMLIWPHWIDEEDDGQEATDARN